MKKLLRRILRRLLKYSGYHIMDLSVDYLVSDSSSTSAQRREEAEKRLLEQVKKYIHHSKKGNRRVLNIRLHLK